MADETLKKQGSDYSEENIITLEWYEHIRRRSGMYIGRLAMANGRVTVSTFS